MDVPTSLAAGPAPRLLALALGLALALPAAAQDSDTASNDAPAANAGASMPAGAQPAYDAAAVDEATSAGVDAIHAHALHATDPAAAPVDGTAGAGVPTVDDAGNAPMASDSGVDQDAATAGDTPASGRGADADAMAATGQSDATADTAAQSADAPAPTAAEDDFDALYGEAGSDGTPVAAPAAYDPWERYNRQMHRFNNAVDRRVARPLAQAYVRAVPTPVRGSVSNFFSNLGQPVSAVNALLQGRPGQAAHSLGRFVLNSTLGIGGLFDPATAAKLRNRNEDFGQTLGVWGWKRSRYVELPLFGPRTLRDVLGMAGDAPLSPLRQIERDVARVPLQGLQLVDMRAQLLSTDALREGVEDDYALVRDAWSQRRAYQISGDREGEDAVPDYLRDDPTVVPVDAMPVPINH